MNWVNAMADKGIDLLIGGSPCQGFSSAGRMIISMTHDPSYSGRTSSTAQLQAVLCEYQDEQSSMDIISDALDVEPVFINSDKVSAHNRQAVLD